MRCSKQLVRGAVKIDDNEKYVKDRGDELMEVHYVRPWAVVEKGKTTFEMPLFQTIAQTAVGIS